MRLSPEGARAMVASAAPLTEAEAEKAALKEANRLHAIVRKINYREAGHDEKWRDEVGQSLNTLLSRAEYSLETSGDESDNDFTNAVLLICQRVEEFEVIQRCTKRQLLKMQRDSERAAG